MDYIIDNLNKYRDNFTKLNSKAMIVFSIAITLYLEKINKQKKFPTIEEISLYLPKLSHEDIVNAITLLNNNDILVFPKKTTRKSVVKKTAQATIDNFLSKNKVWDCFKTWLEYKKERRQSYAGEKTIEIAYKRLVSLADNIEENGNEIVNRSIANNWSGLCPLPEQYKRNNKINNSKNENNRPSKYHFWSEELNKWVYIPS